MRIVIIGVGGVGSWAALCAASYAQQMQKTASLLLIDADSVEEKNIARMACATVDNVGELKTVVVAESIKRKCGASFINVKVQPSTFTEDSILLLYGADVVICATDTVQTQRFVHSYCKKNGIRYIRAGYDGDTINVTSQFALTLEDNATEAADAGYHDIPVVFPAIIAGAMAARAVWIEDSPRLLGSIAHLGITDSSLVPDTIAEKLAEHYIAENDYHTSDDCTCERAHCEDGECHTYDNCTCDRPHCDSGDCDHEGCMPEDAIDRDDSEDLLRALTAQHERNRCPSDCPLCEVDVLTAELTTLKQEREETTHDAT